MRPLQLTISAFGPYAGKIEVPMAKLGKNGLYLITGATGAGKTTIFDAICFALYGEASGTNRDASMFRSKYAKADTPTEVIMTFLHGAKEYCIRRNPEYMRPAKKGEGMTKELANAQLQYPDGHVITKLRDVNAAIVELLSINYEQFAQIAMISQGEFLKLLLADTKSRQQIFRELFKTSYYQILQYRLEDARKEVYIQTETAKNSVTQYIAGIAAGEDDVLAPEVDKAKKGLMTMGDTLLLLEQLLHQDMEQEGTLKKEIETFDHELEEVNKKIGKAQENDKLKSALEAAKLELQTGIPRLTRLGEVLNKEKDNLKQKEELSKQIAAIETQIPDYESHDQLTLAIQTITEKITKEKQELSDKEKSLGKQEERLTAYQAEVQSLKNAGATHEKMLHELSLIEKREEELQSLREDIEKQKNTERQLSQARHQYVLDNTEYLQKKAEQEKLEQAYRDGQAGVLAASLIEGAACPVCGSVSHPKPAHLLQNVPSKEELEQSKKLAEKAQNVVNEASMKAGSLQSVLLEKEQEIIKKAGKLLGMESLTKAGEGSLQENENSQKPKSLPEKEMGQELQQIETSLLGESTAAKIKIKDLTEQITREKSKISRKEQLENIIPQTEKEKNNLSEPMAKLQTNLSAMQATLDANLLQQKTLKEKLHFESGRAALQKKCDLEKLVELIQKTYEKAQCEYNDWDKKLTSIRGQMKGYEETISKADRIDLSKEMLLKENLTAQREAKNNCKEQMHARVLSNKEVHLHIMDKAEELAEQEEKLSWIMNLANTANGKLAGKEKIMLETYIQTTYFERIIERANLRLMKMSGAQYELKRMEEASNVRSQSGLELAVVDHYNGSDRSVKSLSGGEQFMASLSLALGLSDEVQSCAGGVQIDTMFVDEGFGTLDLDKLDMVYGALASLTEGNRLVGVISHVKELKEKIDRQIIVTKEKSGGSFVKLQL